MSSETIGLIEMDEAVSAIDWQSVRPGRRVAHRYSMAAKRWGQVAEEIACHTETIRADIQRLEAELEAELTRFLRNLRRN